MDRNTLMGIFCILLLLIYAGPPTILSIWILLEIDYKYRLFELIENFFTPNAVEGVFVYLGPILAALTIWKGDKTTGGIATTIIVILIVSTLICFIGLIVSADPENRTTYEIIRSDIFYSTMSKYSSNLFMLIFVVLGLKKFGET